jgi:hypothetical protein
MVRNNNPLIKSFFGVFMCIESDLIKFLNDNYVDQLTVNEHRSIVNHITRVSNKLGNSNCSEAIMAFIVIHHHPRARIQLTNYLISLKEEEREIID